jgi:hypothetical protein
MSSKKYLSLEEAAAQLRIHIDELIRMREKGEVRGFADRGTWKFRAEDIEELARRRQPDSSPEVPLIAEDDEVGQQPTIITKGRGMASDSDVRLVSDDQRKSKLTGSSAEMVVLPDSDSDVRITNDPQLTERSSDSDVKLVTPKGTDSDSDVRLSDSDSDVRLAPPGPSDSDVQLVDRGGKKKPGSDSDVTLLPRGAAKKPAKELADDVPLVGASTPDSGLALAADSGIRLSGDSGISLATDSGISLQGDSGISLQGDSGIQLAGDSGIRLDVESGIRLSDAPKSDVKAKKKPAPTDELDKSMPMLLPKEDGDAGRTDVEVPLLAESGEMETMKLPTTAGKKKPDTSVVIFEEGSGEGSVLEEEDEAYRLSSEIEEGEELEVAEDILGEDEELEQLEVFDTDESEFEESFVEGGSAVGIPAMGSRIALPYEQEWSAGTVILTGVSAVVMALGAMLAVDLLRVVWGNGSSAVYQGELLGIFAGLFK